MKVSAKWLSSVLVALRDAESAAKDWEAAAMDQADTITELSATIEAEKQEGARRAVALKWIGTRCGNTISGRCWQNNRTPHAEFSAQEWCPGCLAAWALHIDNPPAAPE
jgi:hypothetical protein